MNFRYKSDEFPFYSSKYVWALKRWTFLISFERKVDMGFGWQHTSFSYYV